MLSCIFCHKKCESSRSLKNHEIRCNLNISRNLLIVGRGRPIIRPEKFIGPPTPIKCVFCNKYFPKGKSTPAYSNHFIRCKLNPDRSIEHKTDDGMKKCINALKESNSRWENKEEKLKHSEKMKKVAKENPNSYSHKNISRGKKVVEYNSIKFDNTWELDFYKWCEKHNIFCIRNSVGFQYEFHGIRTYYPDFFLPELNIYVEIKGYETEKDKAKWKNFPKKLVKIFKKDIDLIRKDSYNLIID
jgi:hypothetical protein